MPFGLPHKPVQSTLSVPSWYPLPSSPSRNPSQGTCHGNMAAALIAARRAVLSPAFIADMDNSKGGVYPWALPKWLVTALHDFHGEHNLIFQIPMGCTPLPLSLPPWWPSLCYALLPPQLIGAVHHLLVPITCPGSPSELFSRTSWADRPTSVGTSFESWLALLGTVTGAWMQCAGVVLSGIALSTSRLWFSCTIQLGVCLP